MQYVERDSLLAASVSPFFPRQMDINTSATQELNYFYVIYPFSMKVITEMTHFSEIRRNLNQTKSSFVITDQQTWDNKENHSV